MRALVVTPGEIISERLVVHDDYPQPVPVPGEALVRVTRAGICATDLQVLHGYSSFSGVPGHEFAGVVEAAPDPSWIGRRVVAEINAGCGHCKECIQHDARHCAQRTALGIRGHDGVFAEYVAVPQDNLHALPDSLGDDASVFVEPLAAACEVLENVHVRPSHRVLVLGAGKLGLLCAQVLALTGCDLSVVARHPASLALLRRWDLPALSGESPARNFDIVVDCTGRADGQAQAARYLRPRGVLVVKSTFRGLAELDLSQVVVEEFTVQGSRCGPFAPAIRLLETGRVQVEPLIAARFPLREAVAAFARAGQPGVLKVLLEP